MPDGPDSAVFSYRWAARGSDIEGATGSTYTLDYDDQGLTVQVWVNFTDDAGNPEAMTSAGPVRCRPRAAGPGEPNSYPSEAWLISESIIHSRKLLHQILSIHSASSTHQQRLANRPILSPALEV